MYEIDFKTNTRKPHNHPRIQEFTTNIEKNTECGYCTYNTYPIGYEWIVIE